MLSNITSNPQTESLLTQGGRVCLYGDINYTGKLIRPIERTYPQKWSVQLDRGGYEAVNVKQISLLEFQSSNLGSLEDSSIPFGDDPVPSYAQLQREILALKTKKCPASARK